jgi:hypothetical protein
LRLGRGGDDEQQGRQQGGGAPACAPSSALAPETGRPGHRHDGAPAPQSRRKRRTIATL